MRDSFGDALDRMARLEELDRVRAAAQAGRRASLAAELTEAVRRVLEQHPDTAVTLSVEAPEGSGTYRVAWVDGALTVAAGPAPDAAARLAELIRRDPSLLAPEQDRPA
jgi:phenylpyruvate tautomerase PptA (4-oxalocrotonate tautomerase family)